MYLILTILMLGILSLLERVLLASVQLRQGPTTPTINGFTLPIADGIKLYSKSSTDFTAPPGALLMLSTPVMYFSGLALTVPYNS
jgi:NADH:ubiquinone oxidoreductase subunit H